MTPKNKPRQTRPHLRHSLALAALFAALPGVAQTDLSSQLVSLGAPSSGADFTGISDITPWQGRLYVPGAANNDRTQFLSYYNPSTSTFAREKDNNNGDYIIVYEQVHQLNVVDGELIIRGEDTYPNGDEGIFVRSAGGWRHRSIDPADGTHRSSQIKHRGLFFASYDQRTNSPYSAAGGGACVAVLDHGLDQLSFVGDPLGTLASAYTGGTRKSSFFATLGGELFVCANSNVPNPTPITPNGTSPVAEKWLLRYTGRSDHAFEAVYDKPSDFWSGLTSATADIRRYGELRTGRGLWFVGANLVRVRHDAATGPNGAYRRPVFEANLVSVGGASADIFTAHGVLYALSRNDSTGVHTLRATTNGSTYITLGTFTIAGGSNIAPPALAVYQGDIYVSNLRNLYRIPGSAVGGLPTNNAAPTAGNDSYSNSGDGVIRVTDPALGLLANDADPDLDPLAISLVSGPAQGTLTLNIDGTFVYVPPASFTGSTSFTYQVTDGVASAQATVTLQVGSVSRYTLDNNDPAGVTRTGTWNPPATMRGYLNRGPGFYHGANFVTDRNTAKGSARVRYTPALRTGGSYEVSVYVPHDTNLTFVTNIPYRVVHAGGTANLTVPQAANKGQWVVLGTYTFDAGSSGYVEIDNTGTTGHVPADAVRFTLAGPPSLTFASSQITAYGTGQDGGNSQPTSATVSTDGRAVSLAGNAWKKAPLTYAITPSTVLEVTVNASNAGEIIGLSLDNDNTNTNTPRRGFRLGGSDAANTTHDSWSWRVTPAYVSGSGAVTYSIPVGTYITGTNLSVNWLGFIADDDANGAANVTFSDIRLYEP